MANLSQYSRRYDAAQRACRDGDLNTLKELVTRAQLFRDRAALRRACEDGSWGCGTNLYPDAARHDVKKLSGSKLYDTQDSIRLHTLLQTATTRGHASIVKYLLHEFPARHLHVAEWEVVVNALASGDAEVLKPFLDLDPDIVHWKDNRIGGSVFSVIADLVDDDEKAREMFRLLLARGAQVDAIWDGRTVIEELSEKGRVELSMWLASSR